VEHDPENPAIVVTVRGVGYKAGQAQGQPSGEVSVGDAPDAG